MIKLAQTMEAFEAQARETLASLGFEVDEDTLRFYGQYVQTLPTDELDETDLGIALRASKAKFLAFGLIRKQIKPEDSSAPTAKE